MPAFYGHIVGWAHSMLIDTSGQDKLRTRLTSSNRQAKLMLISRELLGERITCSTEEMVLLQAIGAYLDDLGTLHASKRYVRMYS
jgi:hypothetical protein